MTKLDKSIAKLPLKSLSVRGYRSLENLSIPALARVNLVTGKNSVGKSSLLEAIHLWALHGSPEAIWTVLSSRSGEDDERKFEGKTILFDAVVRLFHGGSPLLEWLGEGELAWRAAVSTPDFLQPQRKLTLGISRPRSESSDPIGLQTQWVDLEGGYNGDSVSYALSRILEPDRKLWNRPSVTKSVILGPRGAGALVSEYWNEIVLSPAKEEIVRSLQMINPQIEDVALFGEKGVGLGPVANVRVAGEVHGRPITDFGDGMRRLFDMMVVLVSSRDGIALIDEVDIGLHYTVLEDMWNLVFDLAQRLNVQVFATTHSWECIEAFESAKSKSASSGELIRLQTKDGKISATVFDDHRLAIAARDLVEVR